MTLFLRVKEVVKAFYEKYERYMNGLVRFAFSLTVFLTIMHNTGYNTTVTNPFIAVGMALLCAFLPTYVITIMASALLVIEFFSISIECACIILVVLLLIALLYFLFRAEDSWIMLLTMTVCLWNFAPALLPIALLFTPIQVLVVSFGCVLYGFVTAAMKDVASLMSATSKLSLGSRVNLLLTDVVTNEKILLILLTLAASMLLITLIRKTKINDAPFIALVAGDFLFLVVFLLGNYFLGITFTLSNYILLGVDMLINALLGFIIINFVLGMDYKRTEDVQFEDDSYYYYVRAVPKSSVSVTNKKVHKITADEEKESLDTGHLFVHRKEEMK